MSHTILAPIFPKAERLRATAFGLIQEVADRIPDQCSTRNPLLPPYLIQWFDHVIRNFNNGSHAVIMQRHQGDANRGSWTI